MTRSTHLPRYAIVPFAPRTNKRLCNILPADRTRMRGSDVVVRRAKKYSSLNLSHAVFLYRGVARRLRSGRESRCGDDLTFWRFGLDVACLSSAVYGIVRRGRSYGTKQQKLLSSWRYSI